MQAQIAKEAEAYQDLKREHDKTLDEVAALKTAVEELDQVRADAEANQAQAQQALKRERDNVLDEVAGLKTMVEELTDAEAKQAEAHQDLKRERDKALDEVAALKATVGELTQARADAEAQLRGRKEIWEQGPQLQRSLPQSVHKHLVLFLVEGVVLGVLGLLAIASAFTGVAGYVGLGWLFLIGGIVGLVTTIEVRHAPGFWWSLLSALLAMVGGIALLNEPVSPHLLLMGFFFIEGVLSIMYAFAHKKRLSARWRWLLVSGIIDLCLAFITAVVPMPPPAGWLPLAVLVSIDMLFGGAAMIAIRRDAIP